MRIFFVGYHNPNFMSFTEYVENAIIELGHEIATFDFRSWLIPGRIRDRVPALHSWDIARINRELLNRVSEFHPDIILITGGSTIFPGTVLRLKEISGAITVNWIADFPLSFDDYAKVGPYYDYFFTSGTDALKMYEDMGNKNGLWLPFACDPQFHRPRELTGDEKKRYGCDICFVGSNYKEREDILMELTGYDLGIWGLGWERLDKMSPLRKFVRGKAVTPDEWTKIYSTSKIVLNIIGHRCGVMKPYVEEDFFRMTNTKVFEILGCGAFQLVDGREDVKALFRDGEHLSLYGNMRELKDRIDYYLREPSERGRIAFSGRKEVIARHTYRHRVEEILSVTGKERAHE